MRKALAVALVIVVGAFVVSGCTTTSTPPDGGATGGTVPSGDGGSEPVKTTEVTIMDFAFSPATIEVAVGQTVTFKNEDSAAHTVTGDGWDSGSLASGETFSKAFDKAGTYAYACSIHPSMTGEVVVR